MVPDGEGSAFSFHPRLTDAGGCLTAGRTASRRASARDPARRRAPPVALLARPESVERVRQPRASIPPGRKSGCARFAGAAHFTIRSRSAGHTRSAPARCPRVDRTRSPLRPLRLRARHARASLPCSSCARACAARLLTCRALSDYCPIKHFLRAGLMSRGTALSPRCARTVGGSPDRRFAPWLTAFFFVA